jgi:hypothetical protein
MNLFCTMPVRSEDWCLGATARAALAWCDGLIFLDHCSTDRSREIEREIADEFRGRVTILLDDDPEWLECQHRQRLLECAREKGATHIAQVDADEILTGNLTDRIGGIIETMPKNAILQPPWVCLARGLDKYYSSGVWFNNWVTMAWRDSPESHWRPPSNGYAHHHRHPMGRPEIFHRPISQNIPGHQGGLMHLQFVSERRLRAKQSAYQIDDVLRWPGRVPTSELARMYGRAVYESDPGRYSTSPVPTEWIAPYAELLKQHFKPDAEPWQEAFVRNAVAKHGRGHFRGLDLFGVA